MLSPDFATTVLVTLEPAGAACRVSPYFEMLLAPRPWFPHESDVRGLSTGTFMETSNLFLSERSPLRIVFNETEAQRGTDRRVRRERDEIPEADGRSRCLAWRVWKL